MQDDEPRGVTKRDAPERQARGSDISEGRCREFDFLSVLDVEGVAQRPVEIGARSEVEVADCVGVE